MPVTPNMQLLLPIPTITPGPTYASENNDAFDLVDSHDHTTNKGVPVPSNGININNDLPFNDFNATDLRSAQLHNNSSPLSLPGDITCVYVSAGDLYYNNAIGQQVQITLGASLNATVIGGIGGDYSTSTALEFYTALTRTFTFWSAPNVPANLDAGAITIRDIAVSPFGITLASPTSLPADYTITLPSALPTQDSALIVSSSGVASFAGGVVPAGGVVMYGGASAPAGYLLCDGTSYLRSAQAALFTAIGTAYGAADGTHFNVPDMRGMFPRGVTGASANDPDASSRTAQNTGGNTGNNVGSQQAESVGPHNHNATTVSPNAGTSNAGAIWGGGALVVGSSDLNPGGVTSTNGTQTNPINVYFNFIIKT